MHFLIKGIKKLHLWLFLEESLTLVELSYVGYPGQTSVGQPEGERKIVHPITFLSQVLTSLKLSMSSSPDMDTLLEKISEDLESVPSDVSC